MKLPPDARLRADVGSLLEAAGESREDSVLEPILIHLRLLARWNDAYGLTRITEWPEVLDRHLRESLLLLRWIDRSPGRLLDVGTGNGFPALPILACRPQLAGVLLERSERKGLFLDAVVREAGWAGRVVVDPTDAEAYEPGPAAQGRRRTVGTRVASAADNTRAAASEPAQRSIESQHMEPRGGMSAADALTVGLESSPQRKQSQPDETSPLDRMSAADDESRRVESRHLDAELSRATVPTAGPSEWFDYVVSRATLAPERFLELATRWVRPGGRVLLLASKAWKDKGAPGTIVVGKPLVETQLSPLRLIVHEPISGRRASFLSVFERPSA